MKKISLLVLALVVLSGFGASAQQKPNQGQTFTLSGKKFCLVETNTPEEYILLQGPCLEEEEFPLPPGEPSQKRPGPVEQSPEQSPQKPAGSHPPADWY
jgi:hypothetical protein